MTCIKQNCLRYDIPSMYTEGVGRWKNLLSIKRPWRDPSWKVRMTALGVSLKNFYFLLCSRSVPFGLYQRPQIFVWTGWLEWRRSRNSSKGPWSCQLWALALTGFMLILCSMSTEITKLYVSNATEKKKFNWIHWWEETIRPTLKLYRQKNFEYFGREIQVSEKRKELHTRCSLYSKKNWTQIKERTQMEAAAKKT